MNKSERIERNQHIINDIKAKMTNAQLKEKYGLDKTAIKKIAKKAGITRKSNAEVQVDLAEEEKVTGGDTFSNDEPTIEDLQEENDNLKDTLADYQERILALEATVKELKADTAQINTATSGYIVPDEDHYIIGVNIVPFLWRYNNFQLT